MSRLSSHDAVHSQHDEVIGAGVMNSARQMGAVGLSSSVFCGVNEHCQQKKVSICIPAAANGDGHLFIFEAIICLQVNHAVLYDWLDMILVRLSIRDLTDWFNICSMTE